MCPGSFGVESRSVLVLGKRRSVSEIKERPKAIERQVVIGEAMAKSFSSNRNVHGKAQPQLGIPGNKDHNPYMTGFQEEAVKGGKA
jgi:hypothetical protein